MHVHAVYGVGVWVYGVCVPVHVWYVCVYGVRVQYVYMYSGVCVCACMFDCEDKSKPWHGYGSQKATSDRSPTFHLGFEAGLWFLLLFCVLQGGWSRSSQDALLSPPPISL